MIRRPPRSTLFSLHDALPISLGHQLGDLTFPPGEQVGGGPAGQGRRLRSEEHTSELQSHLNIVCRLLLEKKKTWHTHLTPAQNHGPPPTPPPPTQPRTRPPSI